MEEDYIDLELVDIFMNKKTIIEKENHIEEKYKMKKRVREYLSKNMDTFNSVFDIKECLQKRYQHKAVNYVYRKSFRNIVQHLNAVSNLSNYLKDFKGQNNKMNSYFELYQYIIQRTFFDAYKKALGDIELKDFIKRWQEQVINSGIYCKDLLHVITMPFAYNMARYKNLSIEDIFNDQYDEDLKIN